MRESPDAMLAEFAANLTLAAIPAEVLDLARRAILNDIATMLVGAGEPVIGILFDELAPHAASGNAPLAARRDRTDPQLAAFLNAAAANVHDFDDTHMPTILHPSSPVLAPLAALAAGGGISGADLLLGFVTGVEVACRIGEAVSPSHYARGWHITSTCGTFGSAAGCARLLKLDPRQMLTALSGAAAGAGGMVETLGTMAKSISVGNAARGGMIAAGLARRGLDGPSRPLTGTRGFVPLFSDGGSAGPLTDGLGHRWALHDVAFKPYPVGVVLNPVIDAVLELRSRAPAAALSSVTLHGHPLLRERTDRPDVETGRLSQVSAQHAIAITLARGRAGVDEFTDAAAAQTREHRPEIAFIDDPGRDIASVRAEFRMRDGRTETIEVAAARGSAGRPMTDRDIEQKLIACARMVGMDSRVDQIITAVRQIEDLRDARELTDLWGLP